MVMAVLNIFNPYSAIFMSSIFIHPSSASNILKSPNVREDFPAPVRPTTPIFSPGLMVNETPKGKIKIMSS